MGRDIEVTHAEREVHGINVFEGRRYEGNMCQRKDQRERRQYRARAARTQRGGVEPSPSRHPSTMLGMTLSLSKGHEIGRRRSASFRLPRR